jgi:hypothetical protein
VATILGETAPVVRAKNLRIKSASVREQQENARRRRPYKVAWLVLVIGGSIVALAGTIISGEDKPAATRKG